MHRHVRDEGIHSSSILAKIADDWGYDCEMSCEAGDIAEGVISSRRFSCGLNVCASHLRTLQDNERSSHVKRSLMITFNLDGPEITYVIDDGRLAPCVASGGATVVTARDEARLSCRYRVGDNSRILVLLASPDDVRDDALAEHLNRRLTKTEAVPMRGGCRARDLARELLAPRPNGVIGGLLAESCALELLAAAIDGPNDLASSSRATPHPRDVKMILLVREKLLANLDADHRLADLARDAGMSLSTFKCKFAAVIGQPVFQFLRDQRLNRARKGLWNDGWTVAQASYYVGYRHPANFSTAFRRRFGVTPKAARK